MILKEIEITNLGSELKIVLYVKTSGIPTYDNEKMNLQELKTILIGSILQKSQIAEALLNGKKVSFHLVNSK